MHYLGDSVYVAPGSYVGEMELTTRNGLPGDPSNRIVLGPAEFEELKDWYDRWIGEAKQLAEEEIKQPRII